MVDISSLGAMAGLLQNLPEIMFWAQIVIYIFLILFFGSIAMKGYKGYLHWAIHLLLRIGTGFVCLITGIGLSSFLPLVSENMILKITQIDLIIGGAISSLVLLASLYIITLRFPRSAVINKKIEALRKTLAKTKDRPPSPGKLDPFIIVGVAIIAVFLVISLMNFRGFPNMTEDMLSQLGITPEELDQLGSVLGGTGGNGGLEDLLPEGVVIEGGKPISEQSPECTSAILATASIQDQLQDPEFLMSHSYSNNAIKSMIERESGKTVTTMFRVTEGGSDIIIAVTEDMFSCFATPNELCLCAGAGS
jgi:hypothetical protein